MGGPRIPPYTSSMGLLSKRSRYGVQFYPEVGDNQGDTPKGTQPKAANKFLGTEAKELRRTGFKRPTNGRNGWGEGAQLGCPGEERLPVEAKWVNCSSLAPSNPGEGGAGPGFPALKAKGTESAETPTKTTEEPHCGPGPGEPSCPRCGYDSGRAWETLSSAGGKQRGGAFWALQPEKGAGPRALLVQRCCPRGGHLGTNRQRI